MGRADSHLTRIPWGSTLVETVDLGRYGVGRFGDARLEARGALLHEALVANPGCRIRRVARGVRRKEMGFTRFLRNPRVSPRALSQAAARVADRVEGHDMLAIQDTSQIVLGLVTVNFTHSRITRQVLLVTTFQAIGCRQTIFSYCSPLKVLDGRTFTQRT
jgi:hypothetical protein